MTTKKMKDELCKGTKQQCAGMKYVLEGSGKGGIHWAFLLSKRHFDNAISYKKGKGEKEIIFNFCPFCGRSIKPPRREPFRPKSGATGNRTQTSALPTQRPAH